MKKSLLLICFCALSFYCEAQVINARKTTQLAAHTTDTVKTKAKNVKTRMVGGGAMVSADDIVANISKSKEHTIFYNAIVVSGLSETLKSRGPLTVFAPTNEAFKKLAPGVLDTLLKPNHNADLTKLLTYHVIADRLTSKSILKQILAGKGEAVFSTLAGVKLKARLNGDRNIILMDENGNEATVTTFDVEQNNGMIDVTNTVLLPKSK